MKKYTVYSEDSKGCKTAHTSKVSFEKALETAKAWAQSFGHKVFYVENGKRIYAK
jgi:hypothetical protein